MPTGRPAGRPSRRPRRPVSARPAPRAVRTAADDARAPARSGPGAWAGRLAHPATARFARRIVVLVAICAFLVVLLGSTVAAWFGQRAEIDAMREKVAAQERDVEALRAEQERWRDPAYVQQQARERLKFVKPGERSYTVIDPEPVAGAPAPVPEVAGPEAPDLPWFETVWQSARTADAPGQRR